jgi:hypothetical protein
MAAPVWLLSVDLQAKTATFTTGLADAAKAARGSFNDIGGGASGMGSSVGYSMGEARHSVMLLGEEFGVHLPRALTTFIAGLGPIGAALEAAFPFLAVIVGATLLIEHLEKLREAGVKLTDDQVRFGTAANNAFNKLDEKIIQSKIRAAELSHDTFRALQLQLDLIDHQSMDELVHSFEEVAKQADVVMKELEGSWYTFGRGSEGAKSALDKLGLQYEKWLSTGKDADAQSASGLLHGTAAEAQKVLGLLKQLQSAGRSNPFGSFADPAKWHEANDALNKMGIAHGETVQKQIEAQQILVDGCDELIGREARIAELKKGDTANAKTGAGNAQAGIQAAAARQSAESRQRMGEQSLAADKATAEAALTIHRASLEQRLTSEMDFAGRDRDLKEAANQAEIAALDKSGKDYQNQLKALNDKALEITNEYDTKIAELKAKSSVEVYNRDIQALDQSERQKIETTQQGTAARLAVIDSAIKDEQSKNLQGTNFFSELLRQRAEAARQEAEEEAKAKNVATKQGIAAEADAAKEKTRNSAELSKIAHPRSTDNFAAKREELDAEYNAEKSAKERELADAAKMGKDRVAEERKINDQIAALAQKHTDQQAELAKQQAVSEKSAAAESENAWGQSFLRVAEGHESMGKMFQSVTESMISNALKAAIMQQTAEGSAQLAHAKSAASGAASAVSSIPFVGPVLAPIAAAAVFAGAMAFDNGTDRVPGVGRGDIVPSMLSPGEGVVPGGVMDGLRNMARNGGFDQGPHYHVTTQVHMNASALDADGMDGVLNKHADKLQRHFEGVIRKMNR